MDGLVHLVVKCSSKQLTRGPNQNPRSLDKCNFEVTNENNMIGVSFTLFYQFILKRAGFNHHFLFWNITLCLIQRFWHNFSSIKKLEHLIELVKIWLSQNLTEQRNKNSKRASVRCQPNGQPKGMLVVPLTCCSFQNLTKLRAHQWLLWADFLDGFDQSQSRFIFMKCESFNLA